MKKNHMLSLRSTEGYIPDAGLSAAADIAVKLGMPLLLTGEPGTGKTLFASYVAKALNDIELYKFLCHTNSVYADLFYTYDAIGHFRESQKSEFTATQIEEQFIHFQALGKSVVSKKKSVVLIDEIDKAPRDFPNDLLEAMEDLRFNIPELNNKLFNYSGEEKPIIILTSNSEKDLPQAFLRRVIYYNIPFPSHDLLVKILGSRIFDSNESDQSELVVDHFLKIRQIEGLKKKPATAEFLAWATYLKNENVDFNKMTEKGNDVIYSAYCILGKTDNDIQLMRSMS